MNEPASVGAPSVFFPISLMKTSIVYCASLLAFCATCVHAQQPNGLQRKWDPASHKAAVHTCRQAVIDKQKEKYLLRHKLREDQLPPNFVERITPALEPFLVTCDCIVEVISKEMTLEEVNANGADVQRRMLGLLAPGAQCEPKTTRVSIAPFR